MIPQIRTLEDYFQAARQAAENPESFWADIAATFQWHKPWDRVLDWNFTEPQVRWFEGGQLNITENCLDRHLPHKAHQTALIWEPNHPDDPAQYISYQELYERVCQAAHALQNLGVKKGDRVCIYMPMVPEALVAILATARIGAIHSVVFAGFSATSLSDRINDATCSLVITSDGAWRGNKTLDIKGLVDEALVSCPSVQKVLVFRHTQQAVAWTPGRDQWWHELVPQQPKHFPAVPMDSEDMLFILYTSGSTGKPKGVVHTCGGYMVYVGYSFAQVFQPRPQDVFWCTADVGWITGHSYLTYGPLLLGLTTVVFEGVPTWPSPSRFWQVIERHKVNLFYTAPTAIRALMAYGESPLEGYDLSTLRVLGSVGEPINEEAWHWYHDHVGQGRCPVTDTWWQTETGGILIAPLAGVTPTKPTFATLPLPGIQPLLVDSEGKELIGNSVEGNLAIRFPWPSMLRTTYGDHERCRQTYFSTYPGLYFTGDGARRDEDGYYRILGRVDDVINVSGHRLGTAEVENAIGEYPLVVESAVVGYPHELKGQGIYAFVVVTRTEGQSDEVLRQEIMAVVSKVIGPIAKPDRIQLVSGLPKTRSGKIMRRILRKVAEGDASTLGDTSTLLDPAVVEEIIAGALGPVKR